MQSPRSLGWRHVAPVRSCQYGHLSPRDRRQIGPYWAHELGAGARGCKAKRWISRGFVRGERPDSNRRPPGPQPGALPTELRSPRGVQCSASGWRRPELQRASHPTRLSSTPPSRACRRPRALPLQHHLVRRAVGIEVAHDPLTVHVPDVAVDRALRHDPMTQLPERCLIGSQQAQVIHPGRG